MFATISLKPLGYITLNHLWKSGQQNWQWALAMTLFVFKKVSLFTHVFGKTFPTTTCP